MNTSHSLNSFQRVYRAPILDDENKDRITSILNKLKLMSPTDLVCYGGVTVFQMRFLFLPAHQEFIHTFLLPFVHQDKIVELYDKLSGCCTTRDLTEEEATNLKRIRSTFSEWLKQFVNDTLIL